MNRVIKGPWSEADITGFLTQAGYPVRLACTGEDGFPRVVSLWYHYEQGNLLCVAHRKAQLIALLGKNDKVGFEVAPNEPPYHGVRGQGLASLEPLGDKSMLEDLLQRYLGGTESTLGNWLLARSEEEILITVAPTRLYTWDYRQRMADAVQEN